MSTIYILRDPRDQTVRYFGVTDEPLVHELGKILTGFRRNPNVGLYYWIHDLGLLELSPQIERLVDVPSGTTSTKALEAQLSATRELVYNSIPERPKRRSDVGVSNSSRGKGISEYWRKVKAGELPPPKVGRPKT